MHSQIASRLFGSTAVLRQMAEVSTPTAAESGDAAVQEAIAAVKGLIESGDLDLGSFRVLYQQARGFPTTLTDDDMIRMYADAADDLDNDGWVAAMVAAEEAIKASGTVKVTVAATSERASEDQRAKVLADRFDDAARADLDDAIVHNRENDRSKIKFLVNTLYRLFPTPEDRALLPIPGSKKDDKSNAPYDIASVPTGHVSAKTGRPTRENVSLYTTLFQMLEPTLTSNRVDAGGKGAGKYAEMGDREREGAKQSLDKDYNAGLATLKGAAEIHCQAEAIRAFAGKLPDGTDVVSVTFKMKKNDDGADTDKLVEGERNVIRLTDRSTDLREYRWLNTGDFLRLDVDKASKDTGAGSAWVKLLRTIAKKPRTKEQAGTGKSAESSVKVSGFDDMEGVLGLVASFIVGIDKARLKAWVAKRMADKDGDAFVESAGDISWSLEEVTSVAGFNDRYSAIKASKAKAAAASADTLRNATIKLSQAHNAKVAAAAASK